MSVWDTYGANETATNTIEVSWHNLIYTVEKSLLMRLISRDGVNERVILKGLSGHFRSGQLTAIMGPSGSGKSTLLECISGFRKKGLKGDVQINGSNKNIKIGLIAQNDQLLNTLTVREALTLASMMKNYKKVNDEEMNIDNYDKNSIMSGSSDGDTKAIVKKKKLGHHATMVQNTMRQLGLEICADTRSGSCSGGQRKRLSIGLELISKPNILILDEPTSGLDSSACFQTVNVMQQLTQQFQSKYPIAIVATIHQPSARVFNLFHHVYVISFDGRCVYQGSPQELLQKLANVGLICPPFHNPADYIAEVAANEYGNDSIALLSEQNARIASLRPMASGPKSMTLAQISQNQSFPSVYHTAILFYRSVLTIMRDPMLTSVRFLAHVAIAVFTVKLYGGGIGVPGGCPPQVSPLRDLEHFDAFRQQLEHDTILLNQNAAFTFFTIMFIMFAAMMPTIMTFPMEMHVFKKERTNGWYSCMAYYMAKTFADLPFQFIFPVIYTTITYYYTNQVESWWRFAGFTAIGIATALVGQSQGLLIGAIFMNDVNAAVFLGPITCVPLFLFGGFFVRTSTVPSYFKPITYISYCRFAFEAFIILLYGYDRCEYDWQLANVAKESPEWVLYLKQLLKGMGANTTMIKTLEEQTTATIKPDDYQSLVMDQFDLEDDIFIFDCIALGMFFIVLRVITYFILIWRVNRQE